MPSKLLFNYSGVKGHDASTASLNIDHSDKQRVLFGSDRIIVGTLCAKDLDNSEEHKKIPPKSHSKVTIDDPFFRPVGDPLRLFIELVILRNLLQSSMKLSSKK